MQSYSMPHPMNENTRGTKIKKKKKKARPLVLHTVGHQQDKVVDWVRQELNKKTKYQKDNQNDRDTRKK